MNEIKIEKVSFSYDQKKPVLNNVSLTIQNPTTAIIGQNGAGKSTLVKLCKGLLKPASGDIWINGHNTKEYTAAQLAPHIGLVFQNPADQIFKHRVIDEVMFGPLNIGLSKEEAFENSMRALKKLGMDKHSERNPYDLNLSEQKLVTIASILAMDPPIIIFDEPTIGQDDYGKELIKHVIHELASTGKLVLTIIHDMDFVAENFERTVVMNKGEVILDGPTREVFARGDIILEAKLDTPQVIQIARAFGISDVVLTVDELIDRMRVHLGDSFPLK
ncbi:MAG: ATP-binding cassette domain-containing protein [Caldibacillus sp.]